MAHAARCSMPVQPARWVAGHRDAFGPHRMADVRDAKAEA
jgi:hypothetical protein